MSHMGQKEKSLAPSGTSASHPTPEVNPANADIGDGMSDVGWQAGYSITSVAVARAESRKAPRGSATVDVRPAAPTGPRVAHHSA